MLLVLYFLRPWTLPLNSYEQSAIITLISAIYAQVVCLCLLLMIRFALIVTQAIDKPSGVVTKPFDFYAMTNGSDKPPIYYGKPDCQASRSVAKHLAAINAEPGQRG
jgi:hypothetical protein